MKKHYGIMNRLECNNELKGLRKSLMDEEGNLKAEYTIEGMHINEDGYRAIYPEVMKYVCEEEA